MRTQEDTILQYLREEKPDGAHPSSIVADTGILQYNARINGLRDRFNCTHKSGNKICFAREHIINKKVHNGTMFVYKKTPAPWDYSPQKPIKPEKAQAELF